MTMSKVVERIEVHPESLFYQEHLARYRFALRHLRPGLTLDIACGTGYGSQLLFEQRGSQVVGADVDRPALARARHDYPGHGTLFVAADGTRLPFPERCFHTIVTFETIEHIQADRAYVGELGRVLHPEGVCILSTPNRAYSEREKRRNPYHVREYDEAELARLLSTVFSQVSMFYQGFAAEYHHEVGRYTADIQARKQRLNPLMKFGVEHVYRPLKQLVPTRIANVFIRRLLGLRYPQPELSHISIADQPLADINVYVAVCRF
jgi:ubiquinone/menaquinone biosynthesis C-methylase UbiE